MDRLWKILRSPKLSLVGIIYFLLLFLISVLVPQLPEKSFALWQSFLWQGRLPLLAAVVHVLYLDRVYNSFWVLVGGITILVNLVFCTCQQVRRNQDIKGIYTESLGLFPNGAWIHKRLANKGFIKIGSNSDEVIYAKKTIGRWGTVVFHLGIIMVISGALLGQATRFEGIVNLTEGKVIEEKEGDYDKINYQGPFFRSHQGFSFMVSRVEVFYPQEGLPWADKVYYQINQKGTLMKSGVLNEKEKLVYKGFNFYQTGDWGYSPGIRIIENNQVLLEAYLALETSSEGGQQRYQKTYPFPQQDKKLELTLLPNVINPGQGRPDYKPLNPGILVKIYNGDKIIFKGVIKKRKTLKKGNIEVSFVDLRHWRDFKVTYDKSIPLIYSGYWMGIFGVVVYLFWVPQVVRVINRAEGIKVGFGAPRNRDYYKTLFQTELKKPD